MVGRWTASAIASASRKSFFYPFEYGRTYFAGIKRGILTERPELTTGATTSAAVRRRHDRLVRDVERFLIDSDSSDWVGESLRHGVLPV